MQLSTDCPCGAVFEVKPTQAGTCLLCPQCGEEVQVPTLSALRAALGRAYVLSARERRGGMALMSVEADKPLERYALDYLSQLPYVTWLRALPEVMQGRPAEGA